MVVFKYLFIPESRREVLEQVCHDDVRQVGRFLVGF